MKLKQLLILFVALLLPGVIFVFLKGFGKNEFDVEPLYVSELPSVPQGCTQPALPYLLPDSVIATIVNAKDSIGLAVFTDSDASVKLQRVQKAVKDLPLKIVTLSKEENAELMRCIFFLKEPFDAVVVDNKKRIRGQYDLSDRDEVDRLITELAIMFKQY